MNNTKGRDYSKTFATRKATKERHNSMLCRTYDIKFVTSKMSKSQKEIINKLFREAKWFENTCVADYKSVDTKTTQVEVKVGDVFESRQLEFLSSQMKQQLFARFKENLKTLSTKKANGEKVGVIKFKSVCNSLPLKQFGNTYRIDFDRNRVEIQNIKKDFYVRGLKQIPSDAEIANATLLRQPDGYHLFVTCFFEPKSQSKVDGKIGIDLGIKDSIVTSNGDRYDICVEESKAVKLASRKMNRSLYKADNLGMEDPKRGKNHAKRKQKLKRAYQRVKNKRQDLANKVVHEILEKNSFVAMQDELIKLWHKGWFGKQVQCSALGEVKKKLKLSSKTYVVESGFPSTQLCPHCGQRTKYSLKERKFICKHCGYSDDRDVNAAKNILDEALKRM